jgi:CNT family concentrative nucleoside transporter
LHALQLLAAQPLPPAPGTLAQRLQCLLGLFVFLTFAFLLGRFRARRDAVQSPIPWRALGWGIALQFIFAILVIKIPNVLIAINDAIQALLDCTRGGARMVFGNLVDNVVPVQTSPDPASPAAPNQYVHTGSLFAFFVLPTIIFFSALTAILYHVGIMQWVVQGLAWIMSKSMKTSGAETLSAAANIFVGQTEAPLMVKPFLAAATNSEMMCIMVAGFANIASGVLGLYTIWLAPFIANAGGHLAAACFVSAPASLLISKLLVPETQTPTTAGGVEFRIDRIDANLLDAATRGTTEGLTLALNVAAMLISFTALIFLLNGVIGWAAPKLGLPAAQPWTLQRLLGYPLAPVAWLTGISPAESQKVGSLLGIKTVLNELFAYQQMNEAFLKNPHYLAPRDAVLATYALCGFANFASVGIQIGGISTLAPQRRHDLSRLGLLAMLGGALASHTTACVVGMVI